MKCQLILPNKTLGKMEGGVYVFKNLKILTTFV